MEQQNSSSSAGFNTEAGVSDQQAFVLGSDLAQSRHCSVFGQQSDSKDRLRARPCNLNFVSNID